MKDEAHQETPRFIHISEVILLIKKHIKLIAGITIVGTFFSTAWYYLSGRDRQCSVKCTIGWTGTWKGILETLLFHVEYLEPIIEKECLCDSAMLSNLVRNSSGGWWTCQLNWMQVGVRWAKDSTAAANFCTQITDAINQNCSRCLVKLIEQDLHNSQAKYHLLCGQGDTSTACKLLANRIEFVKSIRAEMNKQSSSSVVELREMVITPSSTPHSYLLMIFFLVFSFFILGVLVAIVLEVTAGSRSTH